MEQTECSETSAYKIQTPGNYPEENIQHTEHGESLKSRINVLFKCQIKIHNLMYRLNITQIHKNSNIQSLVDLIQLLHFFRKINLEKKSLLNFEASHRRCVLVNTNSTMY
jgi:hypothetical protein